MERKKRPPDDPGHDGEVPRRSGTLSQREMCEGVPVGNVEDELVGRIERGIRQMNYPSIPPDFVASVMKSVESKKRPCWYRIYRWARSQHTVTITPMRLAPAAMALLLIGMLSATYLHKGRTEPPVISLPNEARIPITFELKMPEARSVHVVGSFNSWRPNTCEMHQSGETTWTVVLQLQAGRYEYAFLVDGTMIVPDPRAEFYQDDGFGNRNNILVVGNNHETAI